MKWTTSISYFALGVITASAAPVVVPTDNWPPTVYKLKITSSLHKPLVGHYLTMTNNTVGFNVNRAETPLQVYPRAGASANKVSLHTYPVGIVDHCIGLVGPAGSLLTLTDLPNPAAISYPAGTTADWTSFTMGGGSAEAEGGRAAAPLLGYSSVGVGAGAWIAMPSGNLGDWTVQWDDGKAMRIDTYQNIKLSYEAMPETAGGNTVRN